MKKRYVNSSCITREIEHDETEKEVRTLLLSFSNCVNLNERENFLYKLVKRGKIEEVRQLTRRKGLLLELQEVERRVKSEQRESSFNLRRQKLVESTAHLCKAKTLEELNQITMFL